MCGIFGCMYGPDGPEAEELTPSEIAQLMFPAIVHRGADAFGWMQYDGKEVTMLKRPGRCDAPKMEKWMELKPDAKWFVGHVRKYTVGDPSYNGNNHPLHHKRIIGVHNGMVRNYESVLAVTGRMDDKVEVDSEAVFAAVHKWGHRGGLKRLAGSIVAVYADLEKPATLHIGRTKGRPLVLATTEAGSIIFASEEKVLEASGLNYKDEYKLGQNALVRLREGKVRSRIQFAVPEPEPEASVVRYHKPPNKNPTKKKKRRPEELLGNGYKSMPAGISSKSWVEAQFLDIERKLGIQRNEKGKIVNDDVPKKKKKRKG